MEKELISVIIPVYNVEEYLPECLDSVLNQSYKNLEIVLVDDGSKDSSGTICDTYEKKDSRIKVIHKKNGGLSDARNRGMQKIKGDYLTFIDSDDWVDKDYVKDLYTSLIQSKADMVVLPLIAVRDKAEGERKKIKNKKNVIYKNSESIKAFLYQEFPPCAQAKLYKTDLWKGIEFPVNTLYEDVETIYQILKKCSRICFLIDKSYFYRQRPNSIITSEFNLKKLDYIKNIKMINVDVDNKYPELKKAGISRLVWAEAHILVHINQKIYPEVNKDIWQDFIKHRATCLFDKNVKLKNKGMIFVSYFGQPFMKKVFEIVKKRNLV